MPPSEPFIRQYSGHSIDELLAVTDTVLDVYANDERMNVQLRLAASEPAIWLARVKLHFDRDVKFAGIAAKYPRDVYDYDAYQVLDDVQGCLFAGLTDVCRNCGRMEGSHGNWIHDCPTQPLGGDFRLTQKFERRTE